MAIIEDETRLMTHGDLECGSENPSLAHDSSHEGQSGPQKNGPHSIDLTKETEALQRSRE